MTWELLAWSILIFYAGIIVGIMMTVSVGRLARDDDPYKEPWQ
jgi:hypothetical protein